MKDDDTDVLLIVGFIAVAYIVYRATGKSFREVYWIVAPAFLLLHLTDKALKFKNRVKHGNTGVEDPFAGHRPRRSHRSCRGNHPAAQ